MIRTVQKAFFALLLVGMMPGGFRPAGNSAQGASLQDHNASFVAHAGNNNISLSWDVDEFEQSDEYLILVYRTENEAAYPATPDDGKRVENGNDGLFPLSAGSYLHTKHTGGSNIRYGEQFYYSLFIVEDDQETWTRRMITQAQVGDTSPPSPLSAFETVKGDRAVLLRWTNPDDSDYYATHIRYKIGSYPSSTEDGDPVENGEDGFFRGTPGRDGSYTHTGLVNGTPYYYAAFAVDFSNNIESYGFRDGPATPLDAGAPGEVVDFTIDEREGELSLRWVHPPDSDLLGTIVRFSDERIISNPSDGQPVPNDHGGYFEGKPGRFEGFVHSGLVNRKTYHYAIFTVDNQLHWSDGTRKSATPVDLTPPGLTLGVLQNPYLTSLLDIVVVSTEPLDAGTIELYLDTVKVEMERLDGHGLIWQGDYELTSPGSTSIAVSVADSSGNESDADGIFTAAAITPAGGGKLRSPDGRLVLSIPPGVVEKREYALALPSGEEGDSRKNGSLPSECAFLKSEAETVSAWTVLPSDLLHGGRGELSISFAGTSLERTDSDRIVITRAGDRPEVLETWIEDRSSSAVVSVDRLGTFALAEGPPGSSSPMDRMFASLRGNYPNPFNPSTFIMFEVRAPQEVRIDLYDIAGRLLTTLFDDHVFAGAHTIHWDGTDRRGRPLPSGVYFTRLVTGGGTDSGKLILLR